VADDGGVLYLVVSGAPAPEGIPALVAASLETLRGMSVRVLFDQDAPYERRLPPWHEVIDALPVRAGAG
jgi:hypothetical protein